MLTFEDLNLYKDTLKQSIEAKDGIVLVCVSTGSVKSTTMACMLNYLNDLAEKHVMTLEDPIEYNLIERHCVLNQHEIGIDTPNFKKALRAVLRQKPDIILIGEMRDADTFETSISAAETGHLVFTTLRAASAQQAIIRLFEYFPLNKHELVRCKLSDSPRGIVVQKLLRSLKGDSRIPAQEIMVVDSIVGSTIKEGKFDKIQSLLDVLPESGSRSFDKELFRLVNEDKVSKGDALQNSPNRQGLEMNLKGIFLSESNRIIGN